MDSITRGWRGILFKQSSMSSTPLPCECSSIIILFWGWIKNQKWSVSAQIHAKEIKKATSFEHVVLKGARPSSITESNSNTDCVRWVVIGTEKREIGNKTNHERSPGHGGAELPEQAGETHLRHHPIVAVAVDQRPVEVEHHHHLRHGLRRRTTQTRRRPGKGRTRKGPKPKLSCDLRVRDYLFIYLFIHNKVKQLGNGFGSRPMFQAHYNRGNG